MFGMEDVSDGLTFDLKWDLFGSMSKHENRTFVMFW